MGEQDGTEQEPMRMRKCFGGPTAMGLAILMMLPLENVAEAQAQSAAPTPQVSQSGAANPPQDASSSANGASGTASGDSYPDAPSPASSQSGDSRTNQEQQNEQTKPLGTAAAPYTKPTGVMGSKPAGAVIAPAKQRRVHAILISVGIVAAAGIAIGTVAALSKGSPSRP